MTVQFNGTKYVLCWGRYANGRRALQLVEEQDSEHVIHVTFNTHQEPVIEDEILVKDYSENEGVLAVLIEAGIIEDTGHVAFCESVNIPVCKLCIIPPGIRHIDGILETRGK